MQNLILKFKIVQYFSSNFLYVKREEHEAKEEELHIYKIQEISKHKLRFTYIIKTFVFYNTSVYTPSKSKAFSRKSTQAIKQITAIFCRIQNSSYSLLRYSCKTKKSIRNLCQECSLYENYYNA